MYGIVLFNRKTNEKTIFLNKKYYKIIFIKILFTTWNIQNNSNLEKNINSFLTERAIIFPIQPYAQGLGQANFILMNVNFLGFFKDN